MAGYLLFFLDINGPFPVLGYLGIYHLAGNAGYRPLSGAVYVGNDHLVGFIERFPEILEQMQRSGEPVGLKDADYPSAGITEPGCLKGLRDLRGMVTVIVD